MILEVRILKELQGDFSEVRILKELQGDFSEVRILKELEENGELCHQERDCGMSCNEE
jgi:hypothetical protein